MDTIYKKLLVIMVILALSHSTTAQEKVTKRIENSFEMNGAGELQVNNEYGNITVRGWDQNKVEIVIDITATGKKKENAESLLERVIPDFKVMDNYVAVTSEIQDKKTGFIAKYFTNESPLDFSRSNLKIDYIIKLPSNAELEINNKFGDVVIDGWAGNLKAIVAHGDIWINENIDNADITIDYGKLKARSVGYGNLRSKNGDITIDESRDLRINSRGTNIKIENVTTLDINSNKDEITIGEIGSMKGELKFTTALMKSVGNTINISTKVTDFKVSRFLKPDPVVFINQESSDISLNISGTSFVFDAVLEEGLLRIPKTFENINSKIVNDVKKIREIEATYGKKMMGRVSLIGNKGVVVLKEQK